MLRRFRIGIPGCGSANNKPVRRQESDERKVLMSTAYEASHMGHTHKRTLLIKISCSRVPLQAIDAAPNNEVCCIGEV
jgi:hypothetical protein